MMLKTIPLTLKENLNCAWLEIKRGKVWFKNLNLAQQFLQCNLLGMSKNCSRKFFRK